MQRASRDDTVAFAALVEKYKNVLLNLFLRQGVSYVDGEDLAQQVFLRLWNYRRKYHPSAKFTTFLFMIAKQVRLDELRRQTRRRRLEDGLTAEAEIPPEAKAAPAEGDDVRAAVAALPEQMRDVVELAVFQELPYEEVGTILGIPKGTVKSRMFNALNKLRELMK